jgi:hypothetical protein
MNALPRHVGEVEIKQNNVVIFEFPEIAWRATTCRMRRIPALSKKAQVERP